VLRALALDEPKPVLELAPSTPPALAALIMQLLAKLPEDRPPSAYAVLERLRALEAGATPSTTVPPKSAGVPAATPAGRAPAPRRRRIAWAAILLSVIAAGLCVAWWPGARVPVVTSSASVIPSASSPQVYLSTWEPIASANWPLPRSPMGDIIPNCYETISVHGKPSPHGLGLHPSFDGPASVSYVLGRQYAEFEGKVSLNDSSPRSASPITFTIYGDDRELWHSDPVSTADDTQPFRVSVKGVDRLRLEANVKGRARDAHGVWLEPYLTR
jgi:hypothetical protein